MEYILVTGAAGFIGSHICNYYLSNGDKVFGIDNFCSSKENSKHFKTLLKNKNFHFFPGDICDNRFLQDVYWHSYLTKEIPNIVYNFACPASPPIYQKIPVETLLTCTQGFANIVTLATRLNPKIKIVHASTSEVYGDATVSPQNETYWGNVNSYGVRSNYDEGKRAAEALCYDFLNTHGHDVRVIRIFNTYGPNMSKNDGRVVTNFVNQMLNDKNITMYGNGKQTRSFCYIDDLLKGIIKIGKLEKNPKTPINLGNPGEFTMIELLEKLQKIIPETKSKIVYKPLPGDDPKQRKPDITLAKNILNWEPVVDLETGLTNMVDWAKKNNW